MRLPRVRFTIRRMMVGLAVAGAAFGLSVRALKRASPVIPGFNLTAVEPVVGEKRRVTGVELDSLTTYLSIRIRNSDELWVTQTVLPDAGREKKYKIEIVRGDRIVDEIFVERWRLSADQTSYKVSDGDELWETHACWPKPKPSGWSRVDLVREGKIVRTVAHGTLCFF